jgi:hypothetical protein
MWSTIIAWDGRQNVVHLRRDAELIAEISLDIWAELSAVEYLISEALLRAEEAQSHPPTEEELDLE